jgi:hypothetical protein
MQQTRKKQGGASPPSRDLNKAQATKRYSAGDSSVGRASNQVQYDVNSEVNEIVADVLQSSMAQQVKAAHARGLVSIMSRHFKFFQTSLINLVDKILVLEEKDQLIKNVYILFGKFYSELIK